MKKRFVVFLYLIPAILSLLLIGAHFLRNGNILITLCSLLLTLSLCVREPLIARTVQFALILASVEWGHVAFNLVSHRLASGLLWTKLVIILGSVAVVSLVAVGLFWTTVLKEMYHLSLTPNQNSSPAPTDKAPLSPEFPPTRPTPPLLEDQRRLINLHNVKISVTTMSLLAFMIMDYSTLLGMFTLIVVGLVNASLRRKMHHIRGVLPLADRKKLYTRQTIGMILFALPIIGYYAYLLPTATLSLIVGSVIAAFAIALWATARYEYVGSGAAL